ncbi:MAG: hypothetical protein ABL901_20250 [Hyphomicrobiaceae bacterium]
MFEWLFLIAGFLAHVLYILFTALLIVIVFAILKSFLTDLLDGKADVPGAPAYPRRIKTDMGEVVVYRSGLTVLKDPDGNRFRAKLKWALDGHVVREGF